jgi:hypothetical protein
LHVNLSLLKATAMQRDNTNIAPRNIFTMTSVEGTVPLDPAAVVANPEEAPSVEPLTEQGDVVEVRQVRYLGFLRMGEGPRSSKPVAVLRKDDDVLVLKAGDRINDHLVLKQITSDSVTVRDSGTQVEQTVMLSDEVEGQE